MTEKSKKKNDQQIIDAYQSVAPLDFMSFASGIIIPSATGPMPFGECMEMFQERTFVDLAPSLHAVRDGKMPPKRRFWVERTKKAGKDSDLAVCLMWLMAFPVRPIHIQVGAVDKDQAAIVRQRMSDLLHYNMWLSKYVQIDQWKITHKGKLATIDILAADVPGAHGATPDLLVINELSHARKWEYVETLLNNAMGVPRGVVIIATNAGVKGSKSEVLQKNAIDNWSTHFWKKPSPWLNKEDIEEAKRINNQSEFDRLFRVIWSSGQGDALDQEDIERCFKADIGPLSTPESGYVYIAGLDLGHKHDHCGFVIVGISPVTHRIRVAYLQGWEPSPITKEVDLIEVKETVFSACKTFGVQWLGMDMWQAAMMKQEYERKGIFPEAINFGGKAGEEMAMSLRTVIGDGILDAFDDHEGRLRRDFGKFNIVKLPSGYYKIDAFRDQYGHADVGTALVICLPQAVKLLGGLGQRLQPEDQILDDDYSPLTEEEIDQMPPELRDIWDAQDEIDKEWANWKYEPRHQGTDLL